MNTGTRRPAVKTGTLALLLALAAGAGEARAGFSLNPGMSTLSGDAHEGFESSALYLGIDYTELAFGPMQLGAFLDVNKMTTDGGKFGGLIFYGALVRFSFPEVLGFFVDGRVGPTHGTVTADSKMAIGYGGGAGFLFDVGGVRVGPRVGYRVLTSETGLDPSPTRTSLDMTLQISIGGDGGGGGRRAVRRRR